MRFSNSCFFSLLSFCSLKEYFQQVVGNVRRAVLTYGPNGQSRGVATVEFVKSEHAQLAAQKYNGVDVDNRPMKVSLLSTQLLGGEIIIINFSVNRLSWSSTLLSPVLPTALGMFHFGCLGLCGIY